MLMADPAGVRAAGSLGGCRLHRRYRFLPRPARRIPPIGRRPMPPGCTGTHHLRCTASRL